MKKKTFVNSEHLCSLQFKVMYLTCSALLTSLFACLKAEAAFFLVNPISTRALYVSTFTLEKQTVKTECEPRRCKAGKLITSLRTVSSSTQG